MTIMVTGASGRLGGTVARLLLERSTGERIVVGARDRRAVAGLGAEARAADYDDPTVLKTAFTGVDILYLVSTNGPHSGRLAQHTAAIHAAADAGVGHIVYTGILGSAPPVIGALAWDTERVIEASGVPHTILRHSLYTQNYTASLAETLADGELVSATGSGRVATADLGDLARAAVEVLLDERHRGVVYELTGPRAWRLDELAAAVAERAGTPVAHRPVSGAELTAELLAAGVPASGAEVLVGIETAIAAGAFTEVSPDLEGLLGGPATSMEESVDSALAQLG
ncbi:NmrA family NAD(P)-binding protein [Phytomonospora sp. NPDC050363]|uniref:NmrA family NAD(P)-binding protein n=1 Tax=Phytomonospora sp. NPDC050363 TaxID=3155642 RepID=UPI0033CE795D